MSFFRKITLYLFETFNYSTKLPSAKPPTMILGTSSLKEVEKFLRSGLFIETTNLKLLLVISLTVLISAIPIFMLLLMYLTCLACIVVTTIWSGAVIGYMYLAHVNPDFSSQLSS